MSEMVWNVADQRPFGNPKEIKIHWILAKQYTALLILA